MQAYLVDDEPHALNMLEMFLARTGKVHVAGRAANGFDALAALRNIHPDIWFLDIEMPGMSGLELAANIHEVEPDALIVFTTAYDQYAVAAFEHEALDYLLKPIEMERLSRTIERLTKEKNRPTEPVVVNTDNTDKLFVQLLGTFRVAITNGKTMMWRTAKEKELFAYLLLNNPATSAVHRDRIIEKLWPNEPYEKAKIYLHTCVSLLRKNLRNMGIEHLLRYKSEHYILDKERIRADVYDFLDISFRMEQEADMPISLIEQTLHLYQDELLPQEDYPWIVELSHRLEQFSLELKLKLSEKYLDSHNGRKAAEAAERAISQSPYEEEAYRRAMQAYLYMGKHDHVLRIYRNLKERLTELNIQPSLVTRQLYEQIEV
ncbi:MULTISPECIES: response regulator [Paenibacillus]|uniref:Two-component SAPR family response regulator n=1 Tax=Paenibacillus pabuli TaxID=1472 RepID=A0A855YC22_9BACL|nr:MULTISPECIES: response regulator [Paenibacillus]PWW43444.1 two-component SAPR family response regulator [Paenibacillus pabuli]PXW09351.1 two-component SAPR family response regulator [Paenibacillus taichungensis]